MENIFQLSTTEIQKLESLLAQSVAVEVTSLEQMDKRSCGSGCSGGCSGSCEGSCQGDCVGSCSATCAGTYTRCTFLT